MNSFAKWRVRNEANILRSEKKRTGNELPPEQVKAGGMSNTGPKQFKGQLEGFKSKLSHKEPQPDGLGDKGMEGVGKATFDREPVKAGQTPTISNGVPVGELKGQFENKYPLAPPPPPPRKNQKHPLSKPVYPGSNQDKEIKAQQAKIKKKRAYEKRNSEGNPFGAHMSVESFSDFKALKELNMNPAVATGQQDVTAQPAAPQMPPAAPQMSPEQEQQGYQFNPANWEGVPGMVVNKFEIAFNSVGETQLSPTQGMALQRAVGMEINSMLTNSKKISDNRQMGMNRINSLGAKKGFA
jgi:hypothetical protein